VSVHIFLYINKKASANNPLLISYHNQHSYETIKTQKTIIISLICTDFMPLTVLSGGNPH